MALGGARPRLAILRALGLGDLLTAVPALRALADAFPDHERVLAAPVSLAPLLDLVDAGGAPLVHRVAQADGRKRPPDRLPADLHAADVAVNLHGRGPQSHRLLLLTARPGRLVWFENQEVADSLGAPGWREGEHEVHRWCRLLEAYGIRADPERLDLSRPAGPARVPPGATLVHPGAATPARRWPAGRFAAVARAEARRGRPVLITGSARELGLARAVATAGGLPHDSVLAGRTDVVDLARLVAGAARVVCGDTGVAHLATALRTPSVLIFAPASPAEWGPPADRPWHRVLWAGPRTESVGDGPHGGLLEIEPADAIAALEALPEPDRPRALASAIG